MVSLSSGGCGGLHRRRWQWCHDRWTKAIRSAAAQPFSADELDQLLGPIALYPDPLIGLILPATTVPSDVVLADRFVEQNGDPAQVPNQSWDDSVKGLTHYPDVLKWLDQNLAWIVTQVSNT